MIPAYELSPQEKLALLPESERDAFLADLDEDELESFVNSWEFKARPKQLAPPGDWRIWLILSGRGWGKTAAITQWALAQAKAMPGSRGALVAPTSADARDVLVEGESGLVNLAPDDFIPKYQPTKRRVVFPNGSRATLFSADEPNRLRGLNHHWAICDEIAAWLYPSAFDMMLLGLRLGSNPRVAVATTPRPVPLIKNLVKDPTVHVTYGSTYENRSNLAPQFFNDIVSRYLGTRLGDQEVFGKILEDEIGGLWTPELINAWRKLPGERPPFKTSIVSVDPAVTSHDGSNETGIIVMALGVDDHVYVLEDLSIKAKPEVWARVVVDASARWLCDHIVAEVNNGGDLVESTIRVADPNANVVQVRAAKGKIARAEPCTVLYERGRVHHSGEDAESLATLEKQMVEWMHGMPSPDRLDSLVWGLHDLILNNEQEPIVMRRGVARFNRSETQWGVLPRKARW